MRKVSEARVERGSVSSFGILRRGKTGPFHGPWKHPALKIQLDLDFRGARVYITHRAKTENGNSGANFPVDTLGAVWSVRTGMTLAEKQFTLYPRSVK